MSDYEGSASIIRGSLATSGHAVPRHGLPVAEAPGIWWAGLPHRPWYWLAQVNRLDLARQP